MPNDAFAATLPSPPQTPTWGGAGRVAGPKLLLWITDVVVGLVLLVLKEKS